MNKRKFPLGSEWLYVKIYSGPQTLEKILIGELYKLIADLYEQKLIEKFFFIRYFDEGNHLRIRFKVFNMEQAGVVFNVINELLDSFLQQKLLWNTTYNIYNREIERYGDLNIDDCETIFCYSSWLTISLLNKLNELYQDTDRWLWGCYTLDLMYNKFKLSLEDKVKFLDEVIRGYSGEYNLTKLSIRKLNDKYRNCTRQIETVMALSFNNMNIEIPQDLEDSYSNAINAILGRNADSALEPSLINLLISLVHMHLNRLFQTKQRKNEFVLCYLMNKYYKSLYARQIAVSSVK